MSRSRKTLKSGLKPSRTNDAGHDAGYALNNKEEIINNKEGVARYEKDFDK
jgi:hypothetical protein